MKNRSSTKLSWLLSMCALFFVAILMQCRISDNAGAAADPADLLPLDNDISAFLKKGSIAIMTDQQSILNAINGEAQLYIDYGFMEGVKQLYSNGGIDVDVQIFNHGTEKYASGIFNRFRPSSYETITQSNPEVLIDNSLSTGYQILYTKGSVFLRITTTDKTDFALSMAKQFYLNIDNKISAE